MNRINLKLIIGGILLGTALYFVPFFVAKAMVFLLIFGTVGLLFKGRRRHYHQYYWAMADRIRGMSDEEFAQFKEERSNCSKRWSNHKTEEQS